MFKIIATLIIALLIWTTSQTAFSQEKVFLGDYRQRPPEMVIDEKSASFPDR
jgi:hypothetical protein